MLNTENKQYLMDEFANLMDQLQDNFHLPLQPDNTVDLFRLFQEMLALKTEVKQESRQFKTALDSFKEVFTLLQHSYDVLSQESIKHRQEQQLNVQTLQREHIKPLLLELIELRDRLAQGVAYSKNHSVSWFKKLFKPLFQREHALIQSMAAGQEMMLRRLDQLLGNYEVVALPTLHQPFDPVSMRAVAIEALSQYPSGIVVEESRKGFLWQGLVLRTAEVTVNKLTEDNE